MNKETVIRFRATQKEKEEFVNWCGWSGTDPSKELRKFIRNIVWIPHNRASEWKPEIENGERMWKCPECGGRMIGDHWDEGFCPYEYCPYCGRRNGKRDYTHKRIEE